MLLDLLRELIEALVRQPHIAGGFDDHVAIVIALDHFRGEAFFFIERERCCGEGEDLG